MSPPAPKPVSDLTKVQEMMSATPYRWIPVLSQVYTATRRFAARFWFVGSQVACLVCERTFQKWRGDPELGSCPYCGAAPRHRLLCFVLDKEWATTSQCLDLLHFAPEWGTQRRFRHHGKVGRYVTADLSAPGVDVHTDITALNFPDQSFDAVICSHVLEHVPNDRAAMRELYRILRPGGMAYVQVPFADDKSTDEDPTVTDVAERRRRFGQFDHVRVYGIDLADRLREAEFSVCELRPVRGIDPLAVRRWGLWDDIVFRCKRPG